LDESSNNDSEEDIENSSLEENNKEAVEKADLDSMIPILTTTGYTTEPSIKKLSNMNETELSGVQNFTIKNQWVKIVFKGKTDVRFLNIDQVVKLSHKTVSAITNTFSIVLILIKLRSKFVIMIDPYLVNINCCYLS
jgi:hypothetical protein